jgi:type I restriction enzyme S subunit
MKTKANGEMQSLPSGWKWIELGAVSQIINGSTPNTNVPEYWNGDILWATPTDIGKLNTIEIIDTERKITKVGLDSCSATMLPAGAVLMTSRAPVGNLAIVGKALCTNQGFKSFVPNEKVDNRYLYFVLKHSVPALQKISHGNTFTETTKEMLQGFYIPMPVDVKEQHKIADQIEAQMAEAQRLCLATEKQIEAANALPQNIVNQEMIKAGSPNGHLIDILRSLPASGWPLAYGNDTEGVPFLTLTAVLNFMYDGTQVKFTNKAVDKNNDYWAQTGDIFMSRSNTPELVGQAALYDGTPIRVVFPDLLIRLQTDSDKADIRFVHYWLMSQAARQYISLNARGSSGTMKKITLEMVQEIPFPSHLAKEQQEIIAHNIGQKITIAKNIAVAAELQAETASALLISLLNKTFGGFTPPIED